MLKRSSILALLILFWSCFTASEARAIISGAPAEQETYPWIAGIIQQGVGPRLGLIGGGALVGDQWIITAAHNVKHLSASSLRVWMGTADLGHVAPKNVFNVLAIYAHPHFSAAEGTSENDLALLLLDRRVKGIAPLALMEDSSELGVGELLRVAGWGTTTAGVPEPTPILQEMAAEIVSLAEAQTAFGPLLGETHLPALDPLKIATACVGDSGSPLVKTVSGINRLAGLVSFGSIDCSDASIPTIYTNTSFFNPWIRKYLDSTALRPKPQLIGRGRKIAQKRKPKVQNGTHFGEIRRQGRTRTKAFRIQNLGPGLLTVNEVTIAGRGFKIHRAPAPIIASGKSKVLRIRFRSARLKPKQYGGRFILHTNMPTQAALRYRVAVRIR